MALLQSVCRNQYDYTFTLLLDITFTTVDAVAVVVAAAGCRCGLQFARLPLVDWLDISYIFQTEGKVLYVLSGAVTPTNLDVGASER